MAEYDFHNYIIRYENKTNKEIMPYIQEKYQKLKQSSMLMAQLSVKLAEDGKISEITHAASDTSYMDKLLEEYKINKDII